jgi:hypothetical protein
MVQWFLAKKYNVDVSGFDFDITSNVVYFRDLFKRVAPSISEPFPDAEISRHEDGVFLNVCAEEPHDYVPPPLATPWLSCDPGEINLDSMGLMLAATVVVGLIWMYFLSQSQTLIVLSWHSLFNSSSVRQGSTLLTDPIQAWRNMYGEQNTTWSATVARNCFILAALCKSYGWPVQILENVLDHGGLPRLSPTRASFDVYQNRSSDTPLQLTPQNSSTVQPSSSTSMSTSSGAGRPSCPDCGKRFSIIYNRNKHVNNPTKECKGPLSDKFTCPFCGGTQTREEYHQKHVKQCAQGRYKKRKGRCRSSDGEVRGCSRGEIA